MCCSSSFTVMNSRPLLKVVRKKLDRDDTILTTCSVSFDSASQMMLSSVLYRKCGLICSCSTRSSAARRFSSSTRISSTRCPISSTIWLKLLFRTESSSSSSSCARIAKSPLPAACAASHSRWMGSVMPRTILLLTIHAPSSIRTRITVIAVMALSTSARIPIRSSSMFVVS